MRSPCPHCQQTQNPRDELETVAACLRAVADLLIPETDLHVVNREAIAVLFGYLTDRNSQAQAAYFESRHTQRNADHGH